ncbi:MAG: hypothetical protein QNJ34_19865 [Xenococcaceae cyanobacterium MO_188.B29]|nr:hypothetical protein [Xenococcaceae cyanobacterium MO_188.B29]
MYKIIKILLTTGIVLSIQPAEAIPSKPKIVENQLAQNPNQMMELADAWGFELTKCQGNVAVISHDITGEKACIVPNSDIKAGNFIYDSTNNKIYPETIQETSINNADTQPRGVGTNEIVFDFTNAYDYGVCLDNILLAYENRQVELQQATKNECAKNILNTFGNTLSKDTALELITSADSYATEDLDIKLYPTFGLRRRVAINFGYVYDIDQNNDDIWNYVNVNR